jgi:uncharacterized protein YkwD
MSFRLFFLLCILAIAVGASAVIFQYQQNSNTDTAFIQHLLDQNIVGTTLLTPLAQKTIFAPPPLKKFSNQAGKDLTITGILASTNLHRTENQLKTLNINTTLNQAAANKVDDMFAQQYFEHVSPQNKGPADVVEKVQYEYLSVGENLALGSYASDADLVQAWMDSPGHRANILGSKFTEIGISAKQGFFDGRQAWLAVQTFALPASACPAPSETLRSTFDNQQIKLENLQAQLNTEQSNIEHQPKELESLISEINTLAKQGNEKVQQGNKEIKTGNELASSESSREAQSYWDKGKQLQEEGNQLIQQAQQKESTFKAQQTTLQTQQNSFNTIVNQFNDLNNTQTKTADQLNQQIKVYNDCLNS